MQKSLEDTANQVGDYFKTNYDKLTNDENSYIQRVLRKLKGQPVTEEDKNCAKQLKHEGNCLYEQGKYNEALEKYNKALERDHSNYSIYGNRAMVFVKLGKTEEAAQECINGLKLEPTFAKFYIRLAKIYWDTDKKKSLEYVMKGLEYEPTNEVLLDLKDELSPSLGEGSLADNSHEAMFKSEKLNEQAKKFFKGWTPQQIQDWMSSAMERG